MPKGKIQAGWMYKKGHTFKVWNRRFFVLRERIIEYQKTPTSTSVSGVIPLSHFQVIKHDDGLHFDVKTPGRTYHLRAETHESFENWIRVLSRRLAQQAAELDQSKRQVRRATAHAHHSNTMDDDGGGNDPLMLRDSLRRATTGHAGGGGGGGGVGGVGGGSGGGTDMKKSAAVTFIPLRSAVHCASCRELFRWTQTKRHCLGCGLVFCEKPDCLRMRNGLARCHACLAGDGNVAAGGIASASSGFGFGLPNASSLALRQLPPSNCNLLVKIVAAKRLASPTHSAVLNPYAIIYFQDTKCRTYTVDQSVHPVFNEEFVLPVHGTCNNVQIAVYSQKYGQDEFLGMVYVPVHALTIDTLFDEWMMLRGRPELDDDADAVDSHSHSSSSSSSSSGPLSSSSASPGVVEGIDTDIITAPRGLLRIQIVYTASMLSLAYPIRSRTDAELAHEALKGQRLLPRPLPAGVGGAAGSTDKERRAYAAQQAVLAAAAAERALGPKLSTDVVVANIQRLTQLYELLHVPTLTQYYHDVMTWRQPFVSLSCCLAYCYLCLYLPLSFLPPLIPFVILMGMVCSKIDIVVKRKHRFFRARLHTWLRHSRLQQQQSARKLTHQQQLRVKRSASSSHSSSSSSSSPSQLMKNVVKPSNVEQQQKLDLLVGLGFGNLLPTTKASALSPPPPQAPHRSAASASLAASPSSLSIPSSSPATGIKASSSDLPPVSLTPALSSASSTASLPSSAASMLSSSSSPPPKKQSPPSPVIRYSWAAEETKAMVNELESLVSSSPAASSSSSSSSHGDDELSAESEVGSGGGGKDGGGKEQEARGFFAKISSYKQSMRTLQNDLGEFCDRFERILSVLNWQDPRKSSLVTIVLALVTLALCIFPTRFLLLCVGLQQFAQYPLRSSDELQQQEQQQRSTTAASAAAAAGNSSSTGSNFFARAPIKSDRALSKANLAEPFKLG